MKNTDRLTKISLIEDLNKIKMLMTDTVLTVEEFDELYDMGVEQLEMLLAMNNTILQCSRI